MVEVHIVEALRTPMGRKRGSLSDVHPVDIGAYVLGGLIERAGVDPGRVDDVIFGCIGQIGPQSANLARYCWLAAGLPEHVPAVTIDRQCGSSQQAVHFAAQGILAGSYEIAIAGGVESMNTVPLNSNFEWGPRLGMGLPAEAKQWVKRYGAEPVHQFTAGDLIARHWNLDRESMDRFAVESHHRAAAARDQGRFDNQILPIEGFERDETIRPDTSMEAVAGLKPIREGSRLTIGTASQIADGGSAVLLASGDAVRRLGLRSMGIIRGMTVVGSDPKLMLTGPIPATRQLLDKAGLTIDDIDLFEVNEAFAAVVLAWAIETGAGLDRTNVNGGAIALGHALGSTGTRLLTTLLHELARSGGRYGVETICEGGGLANATLIERVA
ncbi:acetyl-CoA C-acyltransferase [Mycobacterium sp.]|uniref:acetyl-CoA C-acyltransferase n=1 Tax=Mycobacterium sp. TaxID=1785 RepID=UPI001225F835|nr:acetyl-CoA C-acyltransferase [Mycobacterium sp.]TAM73046.1 MAG: acetyl-CoA C-acyltransferase [Mycobacterium sp.]